MSSKSNAKCPCKNEGEGHLTDKKRRRLYKEGGREWSPVATSSGLLAAAKNWKRQGVESSLGPQEGARPCRQLDFRGIRPISDF